MNARSLWDEIWFSNGSPTMFRATRMILALQALWVLLSRPDMPELLGWPAAFFRGIPSARTLRFGIGLFPVPMEWMLFAVLHLSLLALIAGVLTRPAALIAGLLLFHFAPFEEIIVGMPHTFFGGLTVPTLGLIILAFAVPVSRGTTEWSPEFRWPVVLIQFLFSLNYFCAVLAKFRFARLAWFTGENIRRWVIENWAVTTPPWSLTVAASPFLCWLIALGTLSMELLFPLCVISRTARRILVPMAALGHIGIVYTLGIAFPSMLLLLLFVNWDWVVLRTQRAIGGDQQGRGAPARTNQELDHAAPG